MGRGLASKGNFQMRRGGPPTVGRQKGGRRTACEHMRTRRQPLRSTLKKRRHCSFPQAFSRSKTSRSCPLLLGEETRRISRTHLSCILLVKGDAKSASSRFQAFKSASFSPLVVARKCVETCARTLVFQLPFGSFTMLKSLLISALSGLVFCRTRTRSTCPEQCLNRSVKRRTLTLICSMPSRLQRVHIHQ